MDKRIAIFGTGANGSCVALDLVRAGHDVTLIDQWPEHVEAMRANGLTVRWPEETVHAAVDAHHLCDVCALNRIFDQVLLMVKAYDTGWAARLIEPYLAPDGLMVGIQNAMTAGEIAEIVGPDRTVGCVIELSAELFTPGVAQRNTPSSGTWLGIGALDAAMTGRLAEIRDVLAAVGTVSLCEDIVAAKWMKLVVNSMSLGPVAMLGLPVAEAARLPGFRDFLMRVGTESLAVGQQREYRIQPLFGLTPDDIAESNRLLETLFDKLVADIGPSARDCVLQDHLKGRYSEVDLINGLVAEESLAAGRPAPANAAVVEITRRIRSGELVPEPANFERVLDAMKATV